MENWAEFGGPRANFFNILGRFRIANESVNIFEEDFFSLNVSRLPHKVDIYLYDGAHDYDSHYHAITHIWSQLSHFAIIVVDDWNFEQVRQGTFDGLSAVHAVIEDPTVLHGFAAAPGRGNSATNATLLNPAALIVPMTSMIRP